MMSLVEAARAPDYPAEPVIVISNRPGAAGLQYAKDNGIPALALDHKHFESREHFEGQLHGVLTMSRVDLVCLAGFMRLMTGDFVEKWRHRILNIHPALLPSFKGLHTHERALATGVRIHGCTVHLVRPERDEGPIVAQAAVPVLDGDTPASLGARVLAAEHRLYPHALALLASGQLAVNGEKISILQAVNQSPALFSPPLPGALNSSDVGA
jgi:phosphoribosylglycinamide formyltransferase-1